MTTSDSTGGGLNIFLSHAKVDAPTVREVYNRLHSTGFNPWMDEHNLQPGAEWREEIVLQIGKSEVAILFLSNASVRKRSFIREEMEFIISKAESIKLRGTTFLIPALLDDFKIPERLARRLARWQVVKLYESDGYDKLLGALQTRNNDFGITRDNIDIAPKKSVAKESLVNIAPEDSSPIPTDQNNTDIIVFIPGFFGTELSYRNPAKGFRRERVWSADGSTLVTTLVQHPKRLECTTELEVGEVLSAVYFGREHSFVLYQQLFDMIESLGYERGRDFQTFGYDWRLSIKTNAQRLANFLKKVAHGRPVKIIAHSMGGLIARYMLADHKSRDDHSNVRLIIQIATPVLGTSRAYYVLKESAQLGDLCEWMKKCMTQREKGSFDLLKNAMNHFESIMELLPHDDNKILKTKGGQFYSALYPGAWPDIGEAQLKSIQDVQSTVRRAGIPAISTIYSEDIETDHVYEVDNEFKTIIRKFSSEGDGVALGISTNHGSVSTHPLRARATHYVLPSHQRVLDIVRNYILPEIRKAI